MKSPNLESGFLQMGRCKTPLDTREAQPTVHRENLAPPASRNYCTSFLAFKEGKAVQDSLQHQYVPGNPTTNVFVNVEICTEEFLRITPSIIQLQLPLPKLKTEQDEPESPQP